MARIPRYVDNVIAIVKRALVNELSEHGNMQHHKHIRFIAEVEEEGRRQMSDVVFHQIEHGVINTTVFRKLTHTRSDIFLSHPITHLPCSAQESSH